MTTKRLLCRVCNTGYGSSAKVILEANENDIITDVIQIVGDANNQTNYVWDEIPEMIEKELEKALKMWKDRLNYLDSFLCVSANEEYIQKELEEADYWFPRSH